MPVSRQAQPALRWTALRSVALVAAASVSIVGAWAQAPLPSSSSTVPLSSQVAPADPKAGLALTPEQRHKIFQKATEQKDRVKAPPQGITASVGAELPASIELYSVPDDIMIEIPNTKLFKYTMVSGQVLMVDPTSMKVIDVIRN